MILLGDQPNHIVLNLRNVSDELVQPRKLLVGMNHRTRPGVSPPPDEHEGPFCWSARCFMPRRTVGGVIRTGDRLLMIESSGQDENGASTVVVDIAESTFHSDSRIAAHLCSRVVNIRAAF